VWAAARSDVDGHIRRHGCGTAAGTIGVRSEPGVGSASWFMIPTAALAQAQSACVRAPAEAQPAASTLRNMKVLVAEAQPVNRLLAERLLTELGRRVDTAENARMACERIAASAFRCRSHGLPDPYD